MRIGSSIIGAVAVVFAAVFAAIFTAILAPSARAAAEAPPVRIWIGGDVHLDGQTPTALAAALHSLVGDAAGIVNLEGPIAARPSPGAGLRLVNPPAAVDILRAAGVRVVGIANNHAGDAGPAGAAATAKALRAGGLLPAGAVAGFALLRAGGLRIAVTAHDLRDQVPATLTADLHEARRRADVLVATFHVTGPATYLPSPALKRAVQSAVAAGAAVIAVHGSHLAGAVERRGSTVIAWGLGNLTFACDCTVEDEALLLEVELGRGGAGRATVIPIRAGLAGRPVAPSPDPAGIFDLLRAVGSSPLRRLTDRAEL